MGATKTSRDRTTNDPGEPRSSLVLSLLGPPSVHRDGAPVALPRSRKVRALLSLLVLEARPIPRTRLCDLLWDGPNDPRGELRWCLTKLRGVLDEPERPRVLAGTDGLVAIDLTGCRVDALEVERAVDAGLKSVSPERLASLAELFRGDLLDGVDVDANPEMSAWLAARRQHFRALHVRIASESARRAPVHTDDAFRRLGAWLRLAPFDQGAHERMLEALVAQGRVRDADEHLSATIRAFEQEGLDWSPLRQAWRASREAASGGTDRAVAAEPHAPAIVSAATAELPIVAPRRRASVAVMPFGHGTSLDGPPTLAGTTPARVAQGLTEDIITRLAKLRMPFVIARGTVYALAERGVDIVDAARILNVEYVASGAVRVDDARVSIVVELAEAPDFRVIWADRVELGNAGVLGQLDAAANHVVAAIAGEIEAAESHRALMTPPCSLDAWEAYHRGLWHMYRFTGPDNRHAERFFRTAVEQDPLFARAHAGLSFTHFQNAFLNLTDGHERQIGLAMETAGRSLAADDRDPAAHWAMGRALWLRGQKDDSIGELLRCVDLSPNFALGHYTLGFVQSQAGDPREAIDAANLARKLSPFDPMLFGMLASRALAHVRLGEREEAAEWALKAVARPNAHAHILAIAAECLALADRREEGRRLVGQIRERLPGYTVDDFLRAFRFDRETDTMLRLGARTVGLGP